VQNIETTQAQDLVERHVRPDLPLLSILHGIQAEAGYLPPAVISPLARALNLSRAEVYGFITYYPHFRSAPAAPVVIQVCRAEACRSVGAEALAQHIEQRTGCRFVDHGAVHTAPEPTSPAPHAPPAQISLEPVYCLGLCALSPAITINQHMHARVTPQKFDALLAALESGAVPRSPLSFGTASEAAPSAPACVSAAGEAA